MGNELYFGDNLLILRDHIASESIDTVYLDPPFNSNADYNVLFKEADGTPAAPQIKAFDDTWHWSVDAATALNETMATSDYRVSEALRALEKLVGHNDMLAYLAMMAPRLVELRRVLKPTGNLFLHCDTTASHYLKILLDAVFGITHFRNEIIWKRTSGHSDAKRFGRVHDVILFYANSDASKWRDVFQPYDQEYVEQYYRYEDDRGKFMSGDLSAAGLQGGGYEYEWKGVKRVWRCPMETMRSYEADNRIYYTRNGFPRLKRYLNESPGLPMQDVWTNVEALRSWHKEKLGYPTQKPVELVERVLRATTDEQDVVLDPFCGCGTTISAAQRLNRNWVGIDVTHLAIGLIKARLKDEFGESVQYLIHGEPESTTDAEALAQESRHQFEWWAVSKVGGRPFTGRKGPDSGIDGVIFIRDKGPTSNPSKALISVKSGNVSVSDVRELDSVVNRESAAIGVLVTLNRPTDAMVKEATKAGFYSSQWGTTHPRIQILTIDQIFEGKRPEYPLPSETNVTLQQAPKVSSHQKKNNRELDFD